MLRRGLLCLTVACAPSLAACSLLLGEGFTDADSATPSDAGATSPDSPANGGGEGGGGDGALGGDGSNPTPDGSPTDSGGPLPDGGFVCPNAAVSFCDDFQRDAVQGDWSAVYTNSGGTLTIGKPPGGSRRLESSIIALGGQAQLARDFNLTPKTLHFDFTLDLTSLPSAGGIYITGVQMLNGSGPPSLLYLYANQAGVFFVEQVADGVAYEGSGVPFATGTPHRVVVDVAFGGKLTVEVDGAIKVDKNAETFLLAKPPVLFLGAASIDNTGNGLAMRVDDFIFTID